MSQSIFSKKIRRYHQSEAKLIRGGATFFHHLINLINDARSTIYVQVYIFGDDETGHQIANALMQAAARGVTVYLLADGYASELSKGFITQLKKAGVHFRFFEPLFRSHKFYFGRRLHHKVVVIDKEIALVGGINLADRYNDLPHERAWMDMALEVRGGAALELYYVCEELWARKIISKRKWRRIPYQVAEANSQITDCLVRVRRNDWVMAKDQIWKMYAELFRKASSELTIMCSYFLPGIVYRNILKAAIQRGVKVRVILAGKSDIKVAKYAERYLYRWMLRNGLEIYEYQPSVLHAKVAVADAIWLTVGSYNINDISAYASIELNLEVKSKALGREMQQLLQHIIERDCIHITSQKAIKLFSWAHVVQLISYYVIRVLLKLSTFYFKRQE